MARKKIRYELLDPVQLRALAAYRAWGGEGWKTQLKTDWMRSGSEWRPLDRELDWSYLQQLRNTHGPKWLDDLRYFEPIPS